MANRFHLKPNINGIKISINIQYNTISLRLRFANVEFQNKKRKKQKSTAKVTSSTFVWTDINMQWHKCQTIWRLRSHALPNWMTNFYSENKFIWPNIQLNCFFLYLIQNDRNAHNKVPPNQIQFINSIRSNEKCFVCVPCLRKRLSLCVCRSTDVMCTFLIGP